MSLNLNGNNQMIVAIINLYFKVSETSPEKLDELAQDLEKLIKQVFSEELKNDYNLNLPYKDITDVVFYSEKIILSDSIKNFGENNLRNIVVRNYDKQKLNANYQTENKYIERFFRVHNKLVEHTLLAQAQRDFIKNTIKDTKIIAEQVKDTAENAQKIANKAEDTAQKAEETYKLMFANYVTILGVFTAIIVTIFGGLNVINTVAKNINENKTVILQITALLVLCEVLLLYFLANMIVWITNSQKSKIHWLFFGVIICCIAVILGLYFYPIKESA